MKADWNNVFVSLESSRGNLFFDFDGFYFSRGNLRQGVVEEWVDVKPSGTKTMLFRRLYGAEF